MLKSHFHFQLHMLTHASSTSPAAALAAVIFAATVSAITAKSYSFSPPDNYLLDCGSSSPTVLPDHRTFLSDSDSSKYLDNRGREIQVTDDSANVPLPIYKSANVFDATATYSFHIAKPGWHWLRLHFFPVRNDRFDLGESKFTVVAAENVVLLHRYSPRSLEAKEYLINVESERLTIKFSPVKDSSAFVNSIEVVSAPDMLIEDAIDTLFPIGGKTYGLSKFAFEKVYRVNVGGPVIGKDNLGRSWDSDKKLVKPGLARNVLIRSGVVAYLKSGSPLIAPPMVYESAMEMENSNTILPNFNVTWNLDIDNAYSYLVRLHFCDIVSESLNRLYFNVYIGGKIAISALDLSTVTGGLAVAYYKDFFVSASIVTNPFTVQVGPVIDDTGPRNAILNGLEVLKINNSVNSLDGDFGAESGSTGPGRGTVAAIGFAMMFGAFFGLGAMTVKWQKRPRDWHRSKNFSSWLLPLYTGESSFRSSGSQRSGISVSSTGSGRYLSLAELQDATNNWDPKAVIGVGGFGNVYLGELDDGTKVAVKRGNPQSQQGINEFRTEIHMLSKLRHRHLVSLMGHCDENSEMILVYEFMKNGPLRDHLYGKNLPTLSWKQRLKICIGAARGLHYLHTGADTGIIHRDVKTTNILLDDNFIAKMADFGLSKDVGLGEAHVSTAVKGSFGYLDPEYFRKQQLTEKSDVYSFGVVLFEVLCARPAINPGLVNLAEWAMDFKRKGLLEKIIDPKLAGQIKPESLKKFVEAAEHCLAEYGVDRPTMGDVLWNLEYALQLQQVKTEDDNTRPVTQPAATSNNPADDLVIDDHSGTAVFTEFDALSGR